MPIIINIFKPNLTRFPSDLVSNFTFSCSIDDEIKTIKNSTEFSTNPSHIIQDRNEKPSTNLTMKKNTDINSIRETIDLTADDEDSDATLKSEDSSHEPKKKSACK